MNVCTHCDKVEQINIFPKICDLWPTKAGILELKWELHAKPCSSVVEPWTEHNIKVKSKDQLWSLIFIMQLSFKTSFLKNKNVLLLQRLQRTGWRACATPGKTTADGVSVNWEALEAASPYGQFAFQYEVKNKHWLGGGSLKTLKEIKISL